MNTTNTEQTGVPIRRLAAWDAGALCNLAAEFETPLYVMDMNRVRENCARLLDAFPAATVRYAIKAHSGQAVLEVIRDVGIDVECASAGEVKAALTAGFDGARIQYTAVNPPARDLDAIVEWWRDNREMTITVGAADTVERLRERGFDGRLCIRVNPNVGAGHHEKVTTGANAKFGIPHERVAELAAEWAAEFNFVGLHAHAGSGISGEDLSSHEELVRRMGTLARTVAERAGSIEFVDVGGGFGVPYRPSDPPLDLYDVAERTRDALGTVNATLAIEPGRYVVADAGILLTRANTIKNAREATVVGVDAGMTTLLRPAMYDAYHEIQNISASSTTDSKPVTVAGPICESSDIFAENRSIATPTRGDILAIGTTGAYGYEMASTYNARPRPAEVIYDDNTVKLARRRETLDELDVIEAASDEDSIELSSIVSHSSSSVTSDSTVPVSSTTHAPPGGGPQ
jgi:diaminopimelate decarboxylase (EC 4.1.1.20)